MTQILYCDYCKKICHRKTNLICTRCNVKRYCSDECGNKDWIYHKHNCLFYKENPAKLKYD